MYEALGTVWGAYTVGATAEAGAGVRGKVREGSSQKGTFTKQSEIGRTFQAAGRV